MCRLPKVSTTEYYDWRTRKPSQRQQDNSRLLPELTLLHTESDGVFGSPRIWEELCYQGERCGLNRIARLMRSAKIMVKSGVSEHQNKDQPTLLKILDVISQPQNLILNG